MMQTLADNARTTVMILSSNGKIIGLLDHFYKQMLENASFEEATRKHCERSLGNFRVELTELSAQNEMHMDQMRELRTTVDTRLELVRPLEDLVRRQSLTTSVQLSQRLQLISQRMQARATGAMSFQANRTANESVIMRIITIITLVYLPPTFTSVRSGPRQSVFPPRAARMLINMGIDPLLHGVIQGTRRLGMGDGVRAPPCDHLDDRLFRSNDVLGGG